MKSIVIQNQYHGYEFLVVQYIRDIMQWKCGYVLLPQNHPYAPLTKKRSWTDVGFLLWKTKGRKGQKPKSRRHYFNNGYDKMDILCHGGLTFSEWIKKPNEVFPIAGPWIGWDYCHLGDQMYIDDEQRVPDNLKKAWHDIMKIHISYPTMKDRVWSAQEVSNDCKDVIRQLEKLT